MMGMRVIEVNSDGVENEIKNVPQRRQSAINMAVNMVNDGRAKKVEVYSGYTRIFTARVPK